MSLPGRTRNEALRSLNPPGSRRGKLLLMDESLEQAVREPTREEIDQLQGLVVLEFGAQWCGHCMALRPHLTKLLRDFPQVRHVRIEDGKGQPLGRSFQVKLWPTLVFISDG